jgi:hypothetical protein
MYIYSLGYNILIEYNRNSPLYSKARPTKTEAQNQPWTPSSPSEPSSSTMHPGTKIRKAKEETEEEDVLHEYVVLDIRSIETNQFADGKCIYIYMHK